MKKCDFCEYDRGPLVPTPDKCLSCTQHSNFQLKIRMHPRMRAAWREYAGCRVGYGSTRITKQEYIVNLKFAVKAAAKKNLRTARTYNRIARDELEIRHLNSALEFASKSNGVLEATTNLANKLRDYGCSDILEDNEWNL